MKEEKENNKLAKWLDGRMTDEELREFEALPGFDTYSKIKAFSGALTAPDVDIDTLYQNVTRHKNRKSSVRKLNPWFAKIAATLLLTLGLTYFFYTTHTTNTVAETGARTEFLLPDHSSIVLNAGSEAEYRTWNWDNNRIVELNGEAYFKVAKGKKFDVVTPLGTVTVVGTQFNVKARGNRFDVTCFEGKVMVNSNGEEIMLTPGQSVAFEDGKNIIVPLEEAKQPGWITYEVNFHSEKLTNVIAEMERQYGLTISLPEDVYSPFSGALPMNDLDTALDNITSIYHLKAKRTGDRIVLTSE
ncbi:iron dicitrate transport regulator FecR [Flavobacterium sp. LaA7.5]|nr:iron dicitrate transport regulator FecR [Flavobacterium salilacus subsp. altitudinum]